MNMDIFTQIGLNSSALGVLGSVVHPFCDKGDYAGTVYINERDVAEFSISVAEQGEQAVYIDLAAIADPRLRKKPAKGACCKCDDDGQHFTLCPGGYAVFHVSKGPHRYATVVAKVDGKQKEFDSREINKGDIFSASILRPGQYRVRDAGKKSIGDITVGYPVLEKKAYTPDEPIQISLGSKGMEPQSLRVGPAQGLVFMPESPSTIVVELVKPDDGPDQKRPKHSCK